MPITKATASSIAPAAKGDLVVGSATNDASVLAVGSANQVLTVDSSAATGLKWAAPGSSFSGVTAKLATTVAITPGTATFLACTEVIDTDGYHSDSVNNTRFTVPSGKDGKFLVTYMFNWEGSSSNKESGLRKNGSTYQTISLINNANRDIVSGAFVLSLVATDYIEFYCYNYDAANKNVFGDSSGNTGQTYMTMTYLGA